jgi:hypothetical protein
MSVQSEAVEAGAEARSLGSRVGDAEQVATPHQESLRARIGSDR